MAKFRFQDLDVWKMSVEIADPLFDIADRLEKKRLFRFAGQLRGAAMSMSNNIAEGSGARSDRDFARFLGIARKSAFENANILIILHRRDLLEKPRLEELLERLDRLCRKLSSFQQSLRR